MKAAQRCVESRLEEINSAAAAAAAAARDVPLWRRLAVARRTAHDLHVADIRLRKMAVDVLDWNHDDARYVEFFTFFSITRYGASYMRLG